MSESSPLNPGMAEDEERGDLTVPELVDLAFSSEEVGARMGSLERLNFIPSRTVFSLHLKNVALISSF